MLNKTLWCGLVLFILYSCKTNPSQNATSDNQPETTSSLSSSEKTFPKYAKGFSISYGENYKLLNIHNPQKPGSDSLTYLLIDQEEKLPKNIVYNQLIRTPIRSMVCTSTTHVALTSTLNKEHIISGISGTDFVSNKKVRERISSGKIKEVGNSGQLNKEQVITINPDILMVTGGYGQSNDKKIYLEAGINLISNYEWLETHPLGRAEWVKFLAYFLNEEQKAEETFSEIETKYLELLDLTKTLKEKPQVITGLSFNGTWYIPGGKSFAAKLSADAGVSYFYANDSTSGSAPLDLEVIYKEGLKADFWINPGSAHSLAEIFQKESRTADFKSIKNKTVYNNNKRLNEKGWNDYYESSVTTPHLVLADLIKIFHPDLLPDYELYYYKQLQ